jgi:hypothetical protein
LTGLGLPKYWRLAVVLLALALWAAAEARVGITPKASIFLLLLTQSQSVLVAREQRKEGIWSVSLQPLA